MAMFLPPMVAEVSIGGLAGAAFFFGASWADARPATTATARTLVIARFIFI
jgi:uncharacterized membrane protein